MTTQKWRYVDGSLDSEISVEAENGDHRNVVQPATDVREAAWEQVANWTRGAGSSGAWPPDDQDVWVELAGMRWELVLQCLQRWAEAAASIGNDDEAAKLRAVHGLIVNQLTAQPT